MTQTKEQLLIELTKIRQSHDNWVSGDERRRKEFAKAFDWYRNDMYTHENEVKNPNWTEIYVELGKLIANTKNRNVEDDIKSLYVQIDKIKR